jgi:CO/xanthine dehydrogenase FAD-binding subunit
MPPLIIYDAEVELRSARGTRRMPVSEFVVAAIAPFLNPMSWLSALSCGADAAAADQSLSAAWPAQCVEHYAPELNRAVYGR